MRRPLPATQLYVPGAAGAARAAMGYRAPEPRARVELKLVSAPQHQTATTRTAWPAASPTIRSRVRGTEPRSDLPQANVGYARQQPELSKQWSDGLTQLSPGKPAPQHSNQDAGPLFGDKGLNDAGQSSIRGHPGVAQHGGVVVKDLVGTVEPCVGLRPRPHAIDIIDLGYLQPSGASQRHPYRHPYEGRSRRKFRQ